MGYGTFGKGLGQSFSMALEDYGNVLATALLPRREETEPHKFPEGFFDEICRKLVTQDGEQDLKLT